LSGLKQSLSKVTAKTPDGKVTTAWDKPQTSLASSIDVIAKAKDIEAMRQGFALFSEELSAVLKQFGGASQPLYRVKCPMAFDNRGATWLQSNKIIANPYFGDRMLRCGSVVETLHPLLVKVKEDTHE